MKLSVIVPVYNVVQYIERCLRSLINQDLAEGDYEIIVVNDGSPDKSRNIVIQLQSECKNLILIDQENKGVSVARNIAIERSKGKYILAIDPDDFVIENSLDKFIKKVEAEQLEVLYLGYSVYSEDGNLTWQSDYSKLENKLLTGVEAYNATHGKGHSHPDHSVGIIYKKDFLEHYYLSYPKDVPYLEDGLFIGKVLSVAQRCAFINSPFYQITTRPGSAMNSNTYSTNKARQGFISAAVGIRNFSKTLNLEIKQRGLINHVTAKFILTAIISAISTRKLKILISTKRMIINNGFNKLEIDDLYETFAYVRIYNLSFWLFVIYYIFRTKLMLTKKLLSFNSNP